jgi:hypothetical protein
MAWYLRASNGPGHPDAGAFVYGGVHWQGVVGDWTGRGARTVGAVDVTGLSNPSGAVWYLRNSNTPGAPDITPFVYGAPDWVPVAGDWSGTGHSGIGVFDPSTGTWYLRSQAGSGPVDVATPFVFGLPNWIPLVGDWDGSGKDRIGVFDPSTGTFYLAAGNTPGTGVLFTFAFGGPGWKPVVGDWDGNGTTTVGVVDPLGNWYIRNSNSPGAPDLSFAFGLGFWTPVAGHYPPGAAQWAAGPRAADPGIDVLGDGRLQGVVQAALGRLGAAGVPPGLVSRLASAEYRVGALAGGLLGWTDEADGRVVLSADAAGYGWFIDPDPRADNGLAAGGPGTARAALPGTAARGHMDLLTVVLHEMGHLAGLPDQDSQGGGLMFDTLTPGVRKTQALDAVFAQGHI